MIVLLHVLIALSSVAFATYVFYRPSTAKLNVSYGLIAATIASGTALMVSANGHMLEACTMGLLYSAGVMVLTAKARSRLALQRIKNDRDFTA